MTTDPDWQFVIPGEPTPKERPRLNRYTGAVYTPSKTVKAELDVKMLFKHAYPKHVADKTSDFRVEISLYCGGKKHGDLDNCAKLVLDALNKLLWADDKTVKRLVVDLITGSPNPRTVVQVWRLGGQDAFTDAME